MDVDASAEAEGWTVRRFLRGGCGGGGGGHHAQEEDDSATTAVILIVLMLLLGGTVGVACYSDLVQRRRRNRASQSSRIDLPGITSSSVTPEEPPTKAPPAEAEVVSFAVVEADANSKKAEVAVCPADDAVPVATATPALATATTATHVEEL